MMAFNTNVTF